MPTVGEQTIASLKAAGGVCLAIAAGSVILADKPKVIEAADAAGIAIVGLDPEADQKSEQGRIAGMNTDKHR